MRYAPPPLAREYQRRAVNELEGCLTDLPILVSPTGSGKTVMLSMLCRRLGLRVLWVAHRRELVSQAKRHLDAAGFVDFIATSVQKQARRPIPEGVGLIVIDECHHAIRDSQYQKLFDSDVPVVGATATPFRLDGRGLGDMFGKLVVAATPAELVRLGHIQEPVIYSHEAPDMTGAKKIGGDWSLRELGRRSNRPRLLADIVETWKRRADGARTLAFASTIDHSRTIVAAFLGAGVRVEHLDGKTPKRERDDILRRLENGETTLVSNVGIATEGFDMPALDCAVMARPTASLCLWLQMSGRIMRPEGKCIILDHAGNALRHGSPTRAVKYSLTVDKKQKAEALGLKLCPNCLMMVKYGVHYCPDCGEDLSPVGMASQRIADGELVPFVDRRAVWEQIGGDRDKYKMLFGESPVVIGGELVEPSDANKRKIYQHYAEIAWRRGHKMGWAAVQYKRIYGHWPGSRLKTIVTDLLNTRWRAKA